MCHGFLKCHWYEQRDVMSAAGLSRHTAVLPLSLDLEIYSSWHLWQKCILRVPDQNSVSVLYIMLEIHHSGWEPSILTHWPTLATCRSLSINGLRNFFNTRCDFQKKDNCAWSLVRTSAVVYHWPYTNYTDRFWQLWGILCLYFSSAVTYFQCVVQHMISNWFIGLGKRYNVKIIIQFFQMD